METIKRCESNKCNGVVDIDNPIPIQTGEKSFSRGFCCNKCGKNYWLKEGMITEAKKEGKFYLK